MIENLPDVSDINALLDAIRHLGAKVERPDRHTVRINARDIHAVTVEDEHMRKIRASYYFIGALLGKYKSAEVPLPGGCTIGSRPIDQHLKGFRALGSDVSIMRGAVIAHAIDLVASHIYLDVVSVGATINIMMAATMAEGETILENVAKEPHVVDVANFLNSMGANIKGAGTDVIRIRGVRHLHGTTYSIIPDQIEAGTFMCAAAVTRGDITVKNVIPKHLEAISAKLVEMGCEVVEFDEEIRVVGKPKQRHMNFKTLPYPGFPTDMQPQMTVALALADGTSVVTESILKTASNTWMSCPAWVQTSRLKALWPLWTASVCSPAHRWWLPISEPERPWYWPDWPPRDIRWWMRSATLNGATKTLKRSSAPWAHASSGWILRRKPRSLSSGGLGRFRVNFKFPIDIWKGIG